MEQIDKIITNLNRTIKKWFSDFDGLYLYGSYALGNATKDSDIDLVALFGSKLPREKRMNLWKVIGEIEAELGVTFDLHPMTLLELKQNPIYYKEVVDKGVYYGAC